MVSDRGVLAPGKNRNPSSRSPEVADLVFVGLTVALFAALAVLIRAVERR
ncbi:hypothetical protein M1L60_43550 [Actinoplanes sp. TRM 88003]|uniref:Uncharacterized protein n=1 Tax=Paractinoplanes aksuensis TaxID=2939490 RepID=A0ABT1E358_9ACTN|nr:hypothetical protein [Actinoplanes aksuensis]MCO8277477.1 hypothetical protein [Actinoplanes aksuensis]